MQNNLHSTTPALKHILQTIILSVALLMSVPAHAGVIEEVYTRDRNLLAVSHYNSLATADSAVQEILLEINPETPTATPVLSLLGSNILIESVDNIDSNNWAEAILFSLPLEKDNDWVYIFHIKSAEEYVGALLGTGNIRQEDSQEGITRYRRTEGLDSEVYYLTYGDNNIAIMSRSFAATKKTAELYKDPALSKAGLISNTDTDYTMTFHLNRYFQANSRVLPDFLSMLHYDILRDLAGTTAKSDNILNFILSYLDSTISSFIKEIAILDLKVYLKETDIRVDTELYIQYGGSLHYALSAYESQSDTADILITDKTILLNQMNLWPEEYIQLLEGVGNLATSLTTKTINNDTSLRAGRILSMFQKANPLSIQQGIITPEENTTRYGPVAVSVTTFSDTSVLTELFSEINYILTAGEYSEFLAENGIKIEINSSPAATHTDGTQINETELSVNSTYFTLPDAFLRNQHILYGITDNKLITVTPLAPLTDIQYDNTRSFCLSVLKDTIDLQSKPQNNNSNNPVFSSSQKHYSEKTILNLTFNPLRYIQVVMDSEAIWPSPSPPNRLPIPWQEFSQFFNSKTADNPPLNLTVNSNRTSVSSNLVLPKKTLVSLMQSLLNLTPAGEF